MAGMVEEVREHRRRLWSEYRAEYPGSTKFTFNDWLVFRAFWSRGKGDGMTGKTDEYYVRVLNDIVWKGVERFNEKVGFGFKATLQGEVSREILLALPAIKEIL